MVTAISLSELNCDIDLITGSSLKNIKSNRTIAISENNFYFLKKLGIFKSSKDRMWNCSKMKLYTEENIEEFKEIFDLDNGEKKENIFHMYENIKMIKLMMNKIKEIKSISLFENKKVTKIYNSGLLKNVKFNNKTSKYNLVIICSGYNSSLINNVFNQKMIENSYKEFAITTTIKHSSTKNNIARQIFLNDQIFAMLPISKNKTSIVWTLKSYMKKKNNFFLKKKIKNYASNFLKNIKFYSSIENKDLNFMVRNKYFFERTLLFGDALHLMHPFIGQSFNMTLRDLKCLGKILEKKINLGLDIGASDVLSEFSKEAKPRNFSFSVGSDILKRILSFKRARNDIFKILNKKNFSKKIVFNIANKGIRF